MDGVIVHIATFLQGGAGRVVADLACAQRRLGHRVIVAVSKTQEPGYETYPEYVERLRGADVELVIADSAFKRRAELNAALAQAIVSQLGSDIPNVIHAHAAIPAYVGKLVREMLWTRHDESHAVPIVQTMHGWSLRREPAHAAQDLEIMASVDAVVFPSMASAALVLGLGARLTRWSVVPCGIASRRSDGRPFDALGSLLERRERGARILLTIGSLTAQKNHLIVIDALPAILRRWNVELVVVGEGPETALLLDRAARLGVTDRVHLTGYLRDAAAALNIADLFIQPSLVETFGMAVVEAFRARVPVVSSDIPSLNELVAPGFTGWRFDPMRQESLSAAVIAALDCPAAAREAVLDNAERLFSTRLTVEQMVSRYDSVYANTRAAASTLVSSSSGQNP